MQELLSRISVQAGCREVFVSFEPTKDAAAAIHGSLGFEPTGRVDVGKTVGRLALRQDAAAA